MAKRKSAKPEPEIIGASELAAMVGLRRERVYQLAREGKLPPTVRLGDGPQKWRRREILDWIASGMPDPDRWTWQPTLPQTFRQYIAELKREALALQHEVDGLKSERATLETGEIHHGL